MAWAWVTNDKDGQGKENHQGRLEGSSDRESKEHIWAEERIRKQYPPSDRVPQLRHLGSDPCQVERVLGVSRQPCQTL
eukprot:CAMPEP_0180536294 /NCGR_PEP_ID=MMETSP1036_2-20121128/65201_1 /TAXON_ID=632150 /ORGANISM="Azadinium spinosum, Strain 3D9" /LENGTH=77 /DNA_ID=CAMNT_0022550803 /DNA_START=43 /DNA_END=273 /DNA_ORIENTATION=-